jgi:subtilisin family serine protease
VSRLLRAVAAAGLALAALVSVPGPAWAAQATTWNFTQAAVPAAQPLGNYGRGVLVAVVDTWIDFNDTQFGGRVVDEADCATGTCHDHTYAPDSCVHGTHVAGTIASSGYGVAPEADILAVQVLSGPAGAANPGAECSGTDAAVAAGIDFAVAKGAQVINLSVGEYIPLLLQDSGVTSAIQNAYQHGVVVVVAAGNDGTPTADSNYGTTALTVAATGPSGQIASYSDSALFVDLAAPGGDTGSASTCTTADCVLSTFPGNQLGLLEGTSMAAPHVAGVAALLLSQDPGRGVGNVYSTLEDTARPLAGAGSGLIDAEAARDVEASSHPPRSTSPGTAAPSSHPPATTAPAAVVSSPPVTDRSPEPGPAPAPAPAGGVVVPVVGTSPSAGSPGKVTGVAGAAGGRAAISGVATTTTTVGRSGSAALAAGLPSAGPSESVADTRRAASDWLGHHAGVLIASSTLLAGDLLFLAWTAESRRLPGAHRR